MASISSRQIILKAGPLILTACPRALTNRQCEDILRCKSLWAPVNLQLIAFRCFQPIPTEPDISTSCVLVIALICQPGSLISFYDTIWKLFEYGGRQCMLNFSLLCRATRIWKFKNVISFCNTTIAQKIDMQDNCISQKPRQKQKNIQIPLILYLHSIVYNVYPYSINLNLQTWKSEKKI